jgi:putative protein kinase ArgK-like GTPase of G3E family
VSTERLEKAHKILKNEFGASLLGDRIRVQRKGIEPHEVLRALESAGLSGARVESVAPTLEDAFVRAAAEPIAAKGTGV